MPVRDAGRSYADPHTASPCGSALSSRVCSNGLDTWRTLSSLPGMDIERAVCWRNPRAHRTQSRAHQEHDGDRGNTFGSSRLLSCPLVLCGDVSLTLLIPLSSLVIQLMKLSMVEYSFYLLQGNGLLGTDLLAAKAPDARAGVHLWEVIAHG